MTEALYLTDCYLKEFEAVVDSVKDDKYVVLDKTGFYPNTGGQPYDTGKLVRLGDGAEFNVVFVAKFGEIISHEFSPSGLKPGDKVKGVIDWDRRYRLMRMHTAAHIISYLFEKKKQALVTGGQLDTEKSRVDYQLADYNPEELKSYEKDVNEIIARELPVTSHYVSRAEAEEMTERLSTLKMGFPEEVTEVRLLQIGDVDLQACGGTHIKNTAEIGIVRFIKFDNKGKNNRRVYYTIEP